MAPSISHSSSRIKCYWKLIHSASGVLHPTIIVSKHRFDCPNKLLQTLWECSFTFCRIYAIIPVDFFFIMNAKRITKLIYNQFNVDTSYRYLFFLFTFETIPYCFPVYKIMINKNIYSYQKRFFINLLLSI